MTMVTPYDIDLDRNPANFQPLTPLAFLERAAATYPDTVAVIHGKIRQTYGEFYARSRRLAEILTRHGGVRGDTVSVMLPNTPAMLECHYARRNRRQPMTAAEAQRHRSRGMEWEQASEPQH